MQIITGRTGVPHVYAADDAELYELFLGDGDFCLMTGNRFELWRESPTEVRILDGSLIMQGRLSKIRPSDGYDTLTLDNGTVGYKRCDLIVAEYNQTVEEKEIEEGGTIKIYTDILESVELKVIKGDNVPEGGPYVEPQIITGNIDAGEKHQMKLWAVYIDGINADGEMDYRVFLDTTPIQTALDMATQTRSQVDELMNRIASDVADFQSSLNANIYDYADTLAESIAQGLRGSWKRTIEVVEPAESHEVTMDESYSFEPSDLVDVFLNGMRLTSTEYTYTASGNVVTISLAGVTFVGLMEVVISRLAESA